MTTTTEEKLTNAERNAEGWREQITAAHEALGFCMEEGEGKYLSQEAKAVLKEQGYDGTNHTEVAEWIEDAMRESVLSVSVRCSEWHDPGTSQDLEPDEFQILLSTGGPALRVMGELDRGQPCRCWLEHQDWGTPWLRCFSKHEREVEALRWFCSLFWFGE